MRLLLVTRSYPQAGNLYQYPFVHRRVKAYQAAGHEVALFRPAPEGTPSHEFDGVTCHAGGPDALAALAAGEGSEVLAIHGFCETLWPLVAPLVGPLPAWAWLHGSEIVEFARVKAQGWPDPAARPAKLAEVAARAAFWQGLLRDFPDRLGIVHVSQAARAMALRDWGRDAPRSAVIHNPIDTELFAYRAKAPGQARQVLMIRPFDHPSYGNDLAVGAIRALAERADFARIAITIIGDGPLHEATLAPLGALRHAPNVRIEKRFLTQQEIAAEHARHGQFLVPTRLDTQGVSRDEAMASGLVPVTNRTSAVPEFVDPSCAGLADPDDAAGLAHRIAEMIDDPALFLARSDAAAARVRAQSAAQIVIAKEIAVLERAANRW